MMNANDASLLGRQELLRRRMFELKRFDSAEYVLAAQQAVRETANSSAKQNDKIVNEEGIFESDGAGHQGVGRQRYMDQVQAAEAYEREHHLDHEHFETHVHSGDCNLGKAAVSPTRNSLRRQHPLQVSLLFLFHLFQFRDSRYLIARFVLHFVIVVDNVVGRKQ